MSWLFSQALVAEFSEGICLDGELSVPLSGSPTQQAYCAPDKTMVFSRLSRFGMTFKPLTENRGEELLMSYLGAFRAKTSQLPEKARELTGNEAECGSTWRGWLAKYDPATSSWRTAQCSFIEDLNESSVTLPRSGMTRDGLLWEQPMWERRTSVTGFGLWPTPTTQGNVQIRGMGAAAGKPSRGTTLGGAVRLWPTPQASDNRNRGTASTPAIARRINAGKQVMLSMSMDGLLNPTWVEWLMGWPLGWTDLKPLETDKFLNVPQPHGDFSLRTANEEQHG